MPASLIMNWRKVNSTTYNLKSKSFFFQSAGLSKTEKSTYIKFGKFKCLTFHSLFISSHPNWLHSFEAFRALDDDDDDGDETDLPVSE